MRRGHNLRTTTLNQWVAAFVTSLTIVTDRYHKTILRQSPAIPLSACQLYTLLRCWAPPSISSLLDCSAEPAPTVYTRTTEPSWRAQRSACPLVVNIQASRHHPSGHAFDVSTHPSSPPRKRSYEQTCWPQARTRSPSPDNMRSPLPGLAPIAPNPVFHATPDPEDSHSSSSNSPARGDYEESDFFAGNNDSQSSIGVPTFQDMAVSEEECQPPIARLPAEVLIQIFSKLSNNPADLLNCMCVSKVWARNSVDLLWHRPACTTWLKHGAICRTLTLKQPYFTYNQFVKRLNLSTLADRVNDGSVMPLTVCNKVERLTLTNCEGITDHGLTNLVTGNENLLALDISSDRQITELSIFAVAENCSMLQGLNISSCDKISNESLITLAKSCKKIKRVRVRSKSAFLVVAC